MRVNASLYLLGLQWTGNLSRVYSDSDPVTSRNPELDKVAQVCDSLLYVSISAYNWQLWLRCFSCTQMFRYLAPLQLYLQTTRLSPHVSPGGEVDEGESFYMYRKGNEWVTVRIFFVCLFFWKGPLMANNHGRLKHLLFFVVFTVTVHWCVSQQQQQ